MTTTVTEKLNTPLLQWPLAIAAVFFAMQAETGLRNNLRDQLTPSEMPTATTEATSTDQLKNMQALLSTPNNEAQPIGSDQLAAPIPDMTGLTPSPASTHSETSQAQAQPSTQTVPTTTITPPLPDNIRKIATVDALFPASQAAIINHIYRKVGDNLSDLQYTPSDTQQPHETRLISVTATHVIVEDINTKVRTRLD